MKNNSKIAIPGSLAGQTVEIMSAKPCLGASREVQGDSIEVVNWLRRARTLEITREVVNNKNMVETSQFAKMQISRRGEVTLQETEMLALSASGLIKLGEALTPYQESHPNVPVGVQSAMLLVDRVRESLADDIQ